MCKTMVFVSAPVPSRRCDVAEEEEAVWCVAFASKGLDDGVVVVVHDDQSLALQVAVIHAIVCDKFMIALSLVSEMSDICILSK